MDSHLMQWLSAILEAQNLTAKPRRKWKSEPDIARALKASSVTKPKPQNNSFKESYADNVKPQESQRCAQSDKKQRQSECPEHFTTCEVEIDSEGDSVIEVKRYRRVRPGVKAFKGNDTIKELCQGKEPREETAFGG